MAEYFATTLARICIVLAALFSLTLPAAAQLNKVREQAERVAEKSGGSNNLPPKDDGAAKSGEKDQKEKSQKAPTQSQQKQPQEQQKVTKPQPKQTAIDQAINELTDEYQSYLKDGKPEPRKESDYFGSASSEDLSQDKIVAAIQKPIHNDPRVAAYVKWQLLSAVPDKFDDKLVNQALRAYRSAPKPSARPGLEPAQQRQLDSLVKNRAQGDAKAIEGQLSEAIEKSNKDNEPILAYRDALFIRLPQKPEVFEAGLLDAQARVNTGGSHTELLDNLANGIRSWALGASPQQVKAIAQGIRKVSEIRGPAYYEILEWENNRLKWQTREAIMNEGKRLTDLADDLEQQADPKNQMKVK